jgi:DNA-binding LacI/PurR family transcriptional regulator
MPTPPIQNLAAIAAEAGVSRMTVSRALRNARGVDPATRERILAAVEKVGWRPNPMVSAFMSYVRTKRAPNEAGVLAYLTDEITREGRRSLDFYRRFYNGAVERANSRGYRLEVFKLRERGMTDRRLSDVLYARGIRGVVVSPMSSSHAHLNLDWNKFSAAAIGYSLLKPVLSRSTNDQYGTMLLALRELRRLGYERIALALPQANDARVYYHWTAGFYSHHARYYPKDKPLLHYPPVWRDDAAMAWLRKTQPQVLVTTSRDLLPRLVNAGFDIPRKMGFVNLDWSPDLAPASGVDQIAEEVGGSAVDIVVEQINKNESGIPLFPKTVLLTGKWVTGSTVLNLKETPRGKTRPTAAKKKIARKKPARRVLQPA